jgi:sporulation protein YlmC with PRC-barrel domain
VIRVKPRQPGDGNAGPDLDVSGIERIEGGQTVAEIIANKASLSGNEVTVRGKVMKMNAGIMGRNWMYLSDGTVGPGGEKEIMVTTDDVAKVGSIVVVRGPVATDQDYGYGYRYDVLIVKAKLTND